MLDVRRLKVLCEVARSGSFSGAAVALGYTQPAVSRQIATLEAETGTLLVRRVPQGVVLTDAGQLLVDRGAAILARLQDVEVELKALAGLEGGSLRIASFASAAASIVPLAIARFRELYPDVELGVVIADPIDSLPKLRAGELDMAISHDPQGAHPGDDGCLVVAGGDGPGDIELVHLFDDPMCVALPAGHPLADEYPLELSDFAGEPRMHATTTHCPDSRLFLRACHEAGFEPRIAFQNDDYPAILGFVAAGVGVALVPDMVARQVRDDVTVRELASDAPIRPIFAAMPVGYRSPPVAAMLTVLREVSEEWVDQAECSTVRLSSPASGN
jgi:DNA-binding transcriptional LysR family regulator